jgi:hypothetical protein
MCVRALQCFSHHHLAQHGFASSPRWPCLALGPSQPETVRPSLGSERKERTDSVRQSVIPKVQNWLDLVVRSSAYRKLPSDFWVARPHAMDASACVYGASIIDLHMQTHHDAPGIARRQVLLATEGLST